MELTTSLQWTEIQGQTELTTLVLVENPIPFLQSFVFHTLIKVLPYFQNFIFFFKLV